MEEPNNPDHSGAASGEPAGAGGESAGAASDHPGAGDIPEHPDNADWKRIYWITGLLGVAYVILLGIFTLLFNTPAS